MGGIVRYAPARRPIGATIGGSTAAHAALPAQNTAAALTLAATSVTGLGTVTWVWTVVGPSGDETAQIITAGSTTASPTWAAFTAATGTIAGNWTVAAVATDAAGQTKTFTRTVRIGVEGWVLVDDVDLTAGAEQDLTAIASGATFVIDGATRAIIRNGTITSCTVGGGNGLKASFNGSDAYIVMDRSFANIFSGYSIEDDVMVLVRRVTGRTANTNHVDRCGWSGTRPAGCESKHAEGARIATNFGGWVYGSTSGTEPTITGFRRRGRDMTALSSTEASGWPAFSALTKTGQAGLLQDGNDANVVATGDMVLLFVTQGIIATARTNAEFTAQSVWKKM